MSFLSIVILVFCVGCILSASKRNALFGLAFGTLYLTQGQSIDIAGFNFYPTRILFIIAFFRVLSRGEFLRSGLNKLDKLLIGLYLYSTIVLLFHGDESLPLRIAKLIDVFTCYFTFRSLLSEFDDVRWALSSLVLLLVPYVFLLSIEYFGHRTPFELLGASRSGWMRGDRVRCFGTFRHPSLLGSLGASFFPLYVGLAFDRAYKTRAITGAFASVVIVAFSSSGGPLSAFAVAVVGWFLWCIREKMRTFRWCIGLSIILLALIMKAPIWYLIARVTSITGGTGWHRSYLMDIAFRNFDKWWLFGMPVEATRGWFPYTLAATGGSDITNEFIAFGLHAGLLALVMFIILFVHGYQLTGSALHIARRTTSQTQLQERLLWGFGVVLAVHMFNFLGITYFDQFYVIWFAQLAALNSLAEHTFLHLKDTLPEIHSEHSRLLDPSLNHSSVGISHENSAPELQNLIHGTV